MEGGINGGELEGENATDSKAPNKERKWMERGVKNKMINLLLIRRGDLKIDSAYRDKVRWTEDAGTETRGSKGRTKEGRY